MNCQLRLNTKILIHMSVDEIAFELHVMMLRGPGCCLPLPAASTSYNIPFGNL